MATVISRLYDFVTDKANSVKITASRVDGELDQIITALNRKVLVSATAPADPINGQTWVDSANNLVKCYLSNAWVIIANFIYIQSGTPDSPSEGYLWYDTGNNILKAYNGSTWNTIDMAFPASTAQGDLLYCSAAKTLARLAKDTNASRVLGNTGTDNNPAWTTVGANMMAAGAAYRYSGTEVFSGNVPASFTDLDLSAVVGTNRALAILKIASATGSEIMFRTNGDTVTPMYGSGYDLGCSGVSFNGAGGGGYVIVATDANGVVEWYGTTAGNAATVNVVGFLK